MPTNNAIVVEPHCGACTAQVKVVRCKCGARVQYAITAPDAGCIPVCADCSAKSPLFRFKTEMEPGDADQRFVVVEDRGDRVLVEETTLFGSWAIKPQFVYLKSDLEEVTQ